MGFTNPWLLLGLAVLAVPVLVHLVLREERSGRAFPSLMFVRRIPFELKRRRRLRDLALFAMRCLALAALVMAFAGPYFDADPMSRSSLENHGDVVFLLDRSYSMSHPRRWDRAVAEVHDRIEALTPGERGALIAFDDRAHVVVELTADHGALLAALASVEPGPSGTGFAAAFNAADGILSRSANVRRRIVLVSDLQRSALGPGGALPLAEAVDLEIVPIGEAIGPNATVIDMHLATRDEDAVEDTLTARIRNTGDATLADTNVELIVDGRPVDMRPLSLEPGGEQTMGFPIVLAMERPTRIRMRVGPDALPVDDIFHAVLAPRRSLVVALIEPDMPRAYQGVFLEEALNLAHTPAFEVRRMPAGAIDEDTLASIDALILDDAALPSPSAANAVSAFVERGGGVLLAAGPTLGGAPAAPGGGYLNHVLGPVETREGAGAHIEVFNSDHPLWSSAGLDGEQALFGARIASTRKLEPDPEDRVLARLSDGAPLLVEHTAGAGRILVLATTTDPRWGTLALEPGYVPFVHAALAYLGGGKRWRPAYAVGEVVDLADHAGGFAGTTGWRTYILNGGSVVVENPAGGTETLQGGQGALVTAGEAGIYEAHRADGDGPALPFAANVGRAESMLAAATPRDLERSIVRRAHSTAAARTSRVPEGDSAFEPAWWLLLLAGLALLTEGLMAGWLTQRRIVSAGTRQ